MRRFNIGDKVRPISLGKKSLVYTVIGHYAIGKIAAESLPDDPTSMVFTFDPDTLEHAPERVTQWVYFAKGYGFASWSARSCATQEIAQARWNQERRNNRKVTEIKQLTLDISGEPQVEEYV
jgi:hypothetical protein